MKNAAAIATLDQYLDADHPVAHALLVQGAWGSGKTTFLRTVYLPRRRDRTSDALEQERNGAIVVSLFGLATVADLQRRIWEEISPVGSRVGGLLGAGVEALAKLGGAEGVYERANELLKDVAKNGLKGRVFVFDDLERVEGSLGPLLGFMSQLVETHGARVIVVGNEAELNARKDANWTTRSEKLIGRRVEIEPDPEAIIDAMVPADRADRFAQFVRTARGEILKAFAASDTGNMRSLAWAVANIERVVAALPDAELTEQHTRDMAGLITAVTMAVRSGQVMLGDVFRADDISLRAALIGRERLDDAERGESSETGKQQPPTGPIGRLHQFHVRYADFRPDRPVIAYRFIGQAEATGRVDPNALADWLRRNFSVGVKGGVPAWRKLWDLPELVQHELDETIAELADDLENGRVQEVGPLLHSIGLAIRLKDLGDVRLTDGEPIPEFFERCATKLADDGLLEPSMALADSEHETGYGSLGYIAYGTPEFTDTARRVMEQAARRYDDVANQLAERVVSEAEAGNRDLLAAFDQTRGYEPVVRSPAFASVDADRVAELMASGGANLKACWRFIQERHRLALTCPAVRSELAWLRAVIVRTFQLLDTKPTLEGRARAVYLRSWIASHENDEEENRRLLLSTTALPEYVKPLTA